MAIISVITIPIVLDVIDKAHVGAVIDSAYGYLSSVEKFYITSLSDDDSFKLDGSYVIVGGKLGDYDISFSGNVPTNGRIVYDNGVLIGGIFEIGDYVININRDKISAKKGVSPFRVVTDGDGLYASSLEMDKGRYLYRGDNPNNYLYLKENGVDTLYRIISYETDGTIKVIRNYNIGNYTFDDKSARQNTNNTYCKSQFGCHVWSNQSNTYYKGNLLSDGFYFEYYSSNNSLLKTDIGIVTDESSLKVYLNDDWINRLDDYVASHDFYVGSYALVSDLDYEKELEEITNYTWNGKIGLMDLIDYQRSSTNSECINIYSSINKKCVEENFLSDNRYAEWTMTADSKVNHSLWYRAWGEGVRTESGAYIPWNVRPVFFLKSTTLLNGEGTIDKPFMIESF